MSTFSEKVKAALIEIVSDSDSSSLRKRNKELVKENKEITNRINKLEEENRKLLEIIELNRKFSKNFDREELIDKYSCLSEEDLNSEPIENVNYYYLYIKAVSAFDNLYKESLNNKIRVMAELENNDTMTIEEKTLVQKIINLRSMGASIKGISEKLEITPYKVNKLLTKYSD